MTEHEFWQEILPPGTSHARAVYIDAFPAVFEDGSRLVLPIRALPDGAHAVASLIVNQASFAVVTAIAERLARKLRPLTPDVIVGLPTLGLTLAAAVAQSMGHARYIPLGTSRKFWYREELSVRLSSITSPGTQKRLYIDPRMLALLRGRRVALVDDVISSGVSMAAAIRLLALCECTPVAVVAAMLQSDRWHEPLGGVPAEHLVSALQTPLFSRNASGAWTVQ